VTTSVQTLRRLAWALVVLAIASAVMTVMYTLALPPLPPPPPEIEDLVQRIQAFVAIDHQLFPFAMVQGVVTAGLFLVAAILGAALRSWAIQTPTRDAMVLLFVIGGTIGIVANFIHIAMADVAAAGICDCAYINEQYVAHDKALQVGWTAANWLSIGAVSLTAIGVAMAGRLVNVSSTWRMVSYLVAVVALLAVGIRVLAAFTFVAAFDPFQVSDLLIAVAAGILVPIWAILLARGAPRSAEMAA
jgi:hypothetical protein